MRVPLVSAHSSRDPGRGGAVRRLVTRGTRPGWPVASGEATGAAGRRCRLPARALAPPAPAGTGAVTRETSRFPSARYGTKTTEQLSVILCPSAMTSTIVAVFASSLVIEVLNTPLRSVRPVFGVAGQSA